MNREGTATSLDASARASLRSATWALRRALGPAAGDRIVATRDHVGLVDDDALWTDLRAFGADVAARRHEAALELYRGPLLEGIDDEWALVDRSAFEDRVGSVIGALTAAALDRGDHAGAIRWARRRVAGAPLDKAAARDLVRALHAAGEYAAALQVLRRLAERLQRDLGVAPATATQALAARVRATAGIAFTAPAAPSAATIAARDSEHVALDAAGR